MWLGTTGRDAHMLGRRKQHKLPRFLLQHGRPLAHEPVGVRVFSAEDSAVCPPIHRRGAVSTWGGGAFSSNGGTRHAGYQQVGQG